METSTSEVFTCHLVSWCPTLGDEVVNANTKIFLFSIQQPVSSVDYHCARQHNAQIHTTQSWFVINPGYAQLSGIQSVIAECGAAADGAL